MPRHHFFDYSDKAPLNFRQELESAVDSLDQATDAITYTPYAGDFVKIALGTLIAIFSKLGEEDNHFSTAVLALGSSIAVVGALSTMIKLICSQVANSAKTDSDKLIGYGMHNGFFNNNPNADDQDEDTIEQTYSDAQRYRVYHGV